MLGPYGLSLLLRWFTRLNKTLFISLFPGYFQTFCSFTKKFVALLTCAVFLYVLVRSYIYILQIFSPILCLPFHLHNYTFQGEKAR